MLIRRTIKFTGENVSEEGVVSGVLTSFENEDAYQDIIKTGALDNWLKSNDTLTGLWAHQMSEIIGRWKDIEIEKDLVKAELHLQRGIRRAEEAITLIKNDHINGISIGFSANEYSWAKRKNGWWGLNFYDIELHEASLVLYPANDKAAITGLRSKNGEIDIRMVERLLVLNGLKREEACDIVRPYQSGLQIGQLEKERKEKSLLNDLADYLKVFKA